MKKQERYLALDVLRGITIAAMILVNTPGSWSFVYAPLRHAEWHGCTPTDLIFPFFLLIMGVSMFFSFAKYGNSLNRNSLLKIGKRSMLIFLIGLFLNSFPQWTADYSHLRILGVLQRIAIVYALASLLVLLVKPKYLLVTGLAILIGYWGVLYFFGGDIPYSLEQNAVIPLDMFILGVNHMYKGFGIPFDPEGLLSSLPAIATTIMGYFTGRIIKSTAKANIPVRLFVIGLTTLIAGWLWGFVFPINKALWTSSYVLYTAGLANLLLALLIWVIDIKGLKSWTSFFVVFGMNPLFIFALSGLWGRALYRLISISTGDGNVINGYTWLYQTVFVPIAGEMNGSLLFALFHVLVFWLIGLVLFRKRIFIKV